mgnify:CR=1 FL=1
MKKIISILFLLALTTPAFAHFDESSIILYDVDEYEAKWEQLEKEYYYKVEHNLPCGSYDDEVTGKHRLWLINEQEQGRQLQGVDPQARRHMNDPLPKH